jgi:hypothetical protein
MKVDIHIIGEWGILNVLIGLGWQPDCNMVGDDISFEKVQHLAS